MPESISTVITRALGGMGAATALENLLSEDEYIHNTSWHESLLSALRALPRKQTQKVLEHILTWDPKGIETYFYHNHYFIMKFIAERGGWLKNRDFLKKQIDDFSCFSWNDGKSRSFDGNKNWERFMRWVSSVKDSSVFSILKEKLLSIAENESLDGWLRGSCAQALGKLGIKDKAVELLLLFSEDENQDEGLRSFCAKAVGSSGVKNKTVVKRLLTLIEDEEQGAWLRSSCAEALGKLGVTDKAVMRRLFTLAEDETQDSLLRRFCAKAIGSSDLKIKDKAVDILIELYLAHSEKITDEARLIYDALWGLTDGNKSN